MPLPSVSRSSERLTRSDSLLTLAMTTEMHESFSLTLLLSTLLDSRLAVGERISPQTHAKRDSTSTYTEFTVSTVTLRYTIL